MARGACMAGWGHAWQGDVHGRGQARWGACTAGGMCGGGGHAWQRGICGGGRACQRGVRGGGGGMRGFAREDADQVPILLFFVVFFSFLFLFLFFFFFLKKLLTRRFSLTGL